jgi:hypothetical protein
MNRPKNIAKSQDAIGLNEVLAPQIKDERMICRSWEVPGILMAGRCRRSDKCHRWSRRCSQRNATVILLDLDFSQVGGIVDNGHAERAVQPFSSSPMKWHTAEEIDCRR